MPRSLLLRAASLLLIPLLAGAADSTYIPLDHWVYPALDRLAALGFIPSQVAGLRPWTRAECRRQVAEATGRLAAATTDSSPAIAEAARLLAPLRRELAPDPEGSHVVLESLSLRAGALAGTVLDDSFHFGQSSRNDFGRPFGTGANTLAGFTLRAGYGRFFASARAEYQHAPARDPDSLEVRQTIARLDGIPLPSSGARPTLDRVRTLELAAGVRLGNLEISAGKQSLWWGPGAEAPLSFSSNAEPTHNVRVSSVHPVRLPGPLRYLGEIRGEFVLGKLGGHRYTWRPWFNAQKISFKLTPDLEMGFTRWSIFWGVGHPATPRSFLRNFVSVDSPKGAAGIGWNDPGDRKGGFDFRYRLPWIRDWVTLYTDSYSDDDPSPLAAPRHAALSPGIYFTRIPGLPRVDLRLEATSTMPLGGDRGGQFLYFNSEYRSGNTNYGYLLGNPAGRDARVLQGWVNYWLASGGRLEFSYRQSKGSARFLPGGSTQTDGSVKAFLPLGKDWEALVTVQVERFWVPALGGARRNAGVWFTLTWRPGLELL